MLEERPQFPMWGNMKLLIRIRVVVHGKQFSAIAQSRISTDQLFPLQQTIFCQPNLALLLEQRLSVVKKDDHSVKRGNLSWDVHDIQPSSKRNNFIIQNYSTRQFFAPQTHQHFYDSLETKSWKPSKTQLSNWSFIKSGDGAAQLEDTRGRSPPHHHPCLRLSWARFPFWKRGSHLWQIRFSIPTTRG